MEITIHRAAINDLAQIVPLFDAYRIFYEQTSDPAGAEKFLQERLQQNESVIFLAFLGDEAIGFTQLYPIFTSVGMQRTWLLNDLFVSERARGKHAGAALLEAAKNFARSNGGKWLMLQTHYDNFIAQKLYEKNGWQKIDDFFYIVYV